VEISAMEAKIMACERRGPFQSKPTLPNTLTALNLLVISSQTEMRDRIS